MFLPTHYDALIMYPRTHPTDIHNLCVMGLKGVCCLPVALPPQQEKVVCIEIVIMSSGCGTAKGYFADVWLRR